MTNGTTTIDYEYNADGIRTRKAVTTARDHVHFYTHSVSEPTCTENGFTRHSCECGYAYVDSPVAATGHTYTASVVESTCTTKGYTLYTCACGDTYQDGAPGHTFTTLVVEPTETVNGFTLHECECGYRYESDPVVSLGSPDAEVIYDVKEYDYIYNGSSLTQLIITTTNYGSGPVVETLYFTYDGSSPMTVTYNGDVFYYVTNLQGDVIAILNDQGTAVVTYSYDAWGNILTTAGSMASTLGVANPLTYRGYVYDDESGLYYLQSRYYNPEVGRFINADSAASTGQGLQGNNMFAYCANNPLIRQDSSGKAFETAWDIFTIGLGIIDVFDDPSDPGAWIGLALDVVDLVPFLTGTGEAYRAYRIADKLAEGFGNLSKAKEYGIKGYNALKKLLKGTDLQAHHIIEKRLVKHLGIDIDNMLSVAVTAAEHQQFTNAWRAAFKYGMDYSTLTVDAI